MKKNAQDLNINDLFFHDELRHWKVVEQPVIPTGTIIEVKAEYSKTGRIKVFKFGRMVPVELVQVVKVKKVKI